MRKKIVFKRILIDDPGKIYSVGEKRSRGKWRNDVIICALLDNRLVISFHFRKGFSVSSEFFFTSVSWDDGGSVGYQKKMEKSSARKMIKNEHERRQILKPYLIDGWSGRKNKKAMALNEPDAHMSMEMKYFRQFHIFFIHVIEWMLIYLFWVSNEKKEEKMLKNCRRESILMKRFLLMTVNRVWNGLSCNNI